MTSKKERFKIKNEIRKAIRELYHRKLKLSKNSRYRNWIRTQLEQKYVDHKWNQIRKDLENNKHKD